MRGLIEGGGVILENSEFNQGRWIGINKWVNE